MPNERRAEADPAPALTRRAFIGEIAAASVTLSTLPLVCGARPAADSETRVAQPRGIVAFHMDQPYWDASGAAVPYLPPPGMRSAAPIAHLSEAELRGVQCYM
jgi:hypothetical protein